MNFTREIKRELLKAPFGTRREGFAFLKAMLDTDGTLREDGFSYTGEDEEIVSLVVASAEQLFGAPMQLVGAARDPKRGRDKLTFSYEGGCGGLLSFREEGEEETAAYLKGAFLGGGSCTLPREGAKTGYHLEIGFPEREKAEELVDRFETFQLFGNVLTRGERSVVYMKSREAIADFLSVVGAKGALGRLSALTSEREERNNENRVRNCYQGNADRTAIASAKLAVAFGELAASPSFAALPDPLKETLRCRLDNPTLSLGELASVLGISKSGLAHRLRRIGEFAEELSKEKR